MCACDMLYIVLGSRAAMKNNVCLGRMLRGRRLSTVGQHLFHGYVLYILAYLTDDAYNLFVLSPWHLSVAEKTS